MVDMKTVDEIHRLNLSLLVEEFGGVGKLAERIERSSSQLSQWLNASEHSTTGKPRGMGPASCRHVEKMCGKPSGWLDFEHDAREAANDPAQKMQLQWVTPREALLLSDYRAVSDKSRGMIEDLSRGLDHISTPAASSKNK